MITKFLRLAALACVLYALSFPANGDEPRVIRSALDAQGHFTVEAIVPAGSRSVVLEISSDLPGPEAWRKMIGGVLDGRAARVTFVLPPQPGGRLFARVRISEETTPPPVELPDATLLRVDYEGERVHINIKLDLLDDGTSMMKGEWASLPLLQQLRNVAAWASAQPHVAATFISESGYSVTVRFTDGNTVVFMENPMIPAGGVRDSIPMASAPSRSVPAPASLPRPKTEPVSAGGLPGSNRFITANSLEPSFPDSSATIGNWMQQNGYRVERYPNATMADVMTWVTHGSLPLAGLFWHAHGSPMKFNDDTETVAIKTSEEAQRATHPIFQPLWDEEELTIAKGKNDDLPFFCITDRFIRKYFRFAPHSIVMLDVCESGHVNLAQSFIDAGAGTVIGWDWLSGPLSGTSYRKIVDRLLGMNEEFPISTPRERSFPLAEIRRWMIEKNYTLDPSNRSPNQTRSNARLVWRDHPTAPADILKPSIKRIVPEAAHPGEAFSKYFIVGNFGPDPGPDGRVVMWGPTELSVLRWYDHAGIVVRVPEVPPTGEIQVTIQGGNYYSSSNKVPMTEWTVPFEHESIQFSSLKAKYAVRTKFRADIRGARDFPEGPVFHLPFEFTNMADCSGTLAASGTDQPQPNMTMTWSGGSNLDSVDYYRPQANQRRGNIRLRGSLDFGNGWIRDLDLSANGSFLSEIRVVMPDGGVSHFSEQVADNFDTGPVFFTEPIRIDLGTGVISGGNRPSGFGSTLSWPAVTPVFFPDERTPR